MIIYINMILYIDFYSYEHFLVLSFIVASGDSVYKTIDSQNLPF